jgi:hypothetical protein
VNLFEQAAIDLRILLSMSIYPVADIRDFSMTKA